MLGRGSAASCRSAATPACRARPSAAASRTSCPGGEPIDDPAARAALRGGVGPPGPDRARDDDGRDARGRARRPARRPLLLGGNFLETMPDPDVVPRRARARAAARPPGHRAQHLDAGRGRRRARAAGRDALRAARRRHLDDDRAAHPLLARDPRAADRRGARRVGDPGGDRRARARRRARRGSLAFADAQAIRDEMERGHAALRGIAGLRRAGDSVQYGGPLLCRDGVFAELPDGRARFVPIAVDADALAPPTSSSSPPGAASSSTR